jgi:EmrB/QacA subfamily drug resistance transporter
MELRAAKLAAAAMIPTLIAALPTAMLKLPPCAPISSARRSQLPDDLRPVSPPSRIALPMTSQLAVSAKPLDQAGVRRIVMGILLAMFLGALDQTIVATALPTIGRDLKDVDSLSWVVTAYLLTATAVTPLYGKLSDIHGRRLMLLVAIGVFAAASVGCALAATMSILILARGLQGLGGGGLLSLAQTIVADVVPPIERGRYQGYIGTVFAASSVGGPVLGGFFAEQLHWSLIFWINLPLGLVAFLMTNNVLKQLPRLARRRHQLDIVGAVMMMVATITLLLALTWGGTRYAWSSAPIAGLLLASAVISVAFVIHLLTAREPFLPLPVLFNPVVGVGTASVTCVFGTMVALTVFVPLYYEVVRGLSAGQSGLALMPQLAGTVIGSTLAGRAMVTVRRYKRMPVVGLLIAIAALGVVALKPAGLPLPVVSAVMGVAGLGIGSLFPITTVSIQNAVRPYQLGTATGVMNFFRSLGGAFMVSVLGAIVLGGAGGASHAGLTLEALGAEVGRSSGDLAVVFRWVFFAAACCLTVGLTCLLVMEERPLRGRSRPVSESHVPAE